jgi:hypothetical protein
VGAEHQCRREYFEDDKAQSIAGMSEKLLKKIVLKLFEQTIYLEFPKKKIVLCMLLDCWSIKTFLSNVSFPKFHNIMIFWGYNTA